MNCRLLFMSDSSLKITSRSDRGGQRGYLLRRNYTLVFSQLITHHIPISDVTSLDARCRRGWGWFEIASNITDDTTRHDTFVVFCACSLALTLGSFHLTENVTGNDDSERWNETLEVMHRTSLMPRAACGSRLFFRNSLSPALQNATT